MRTLIGAPKEVVVVKMHLSCGEDHGKYLTVLLPLKGLFAAFSSSFIFQHKKKIVFDAAN